MNSLDKDLALHSTKINKESLHDSVCLTTINATVFKKLMLL